MEHARATLATASSYPRQQVRKSLMEVAVPRIIQRRPQRVPEKRKDVPFVVLGLMCPSIGQAFCHRRKQVPDLPVNPNGSEAIHGPKQDPAFLAQLPKRSGMGCLAPLDRALDELPPGQGMFKGQDLQTPTRFAQDEGTGFFRVRHAQT